MKFNTIIMGGGLSGLTAGLKLIQAGQRVAIVSDGQSSLHFSSGSFDLLGYNDGVPVKHPLEAIPLLGDGHPYHKVRELDALAVEAQELLEDAGIYVSGNAETNHYRLTPLGTVKPTWLTISGCATLNSPDELPWKRVAVINIIGYLDFPTKFIVANLRKMGAQVDLKAFTMPELTEARRSPSEMRATNIAKVLGNKGIVARMAQEINAITPTDQYDVALLPAVLGFGDAELVNHLKALVSVPVECIATLPPSVPGVRVQTQLCRHFIKAGGIFLTGDRAKRGVIENGLMKGICTAKLTDTVLEADNYILATGTFLSHGLCSNFEKVYEPVFDFDVDYAAHRADWVNFDVWKAQPYMEFGVKTDDQLHVLKQGQVLKNCYAAGSILSGHNSVKLADKEGVSLLTALQVVKNILNR